MLRQLPNVITIGRIVMIVPFAWFLYRDNHLGALVLFFIAGLSDGIDGFLARKYRLQSRFGSIADPMADKLLLMTAYAMLTFIEQLPLWLLVVVISRDLVLVVGGLLYHFRIGRYEVEPSIWGKLCTFTQISFAVLVLVHLALIPLPQAFVDIGAYTVAFITLLSGIHYIAVWSKRAMIAKADEGQE